ncbi:MAG: cobalt-precorrin-5B (C(1))-methyltransferase [Actinomycetota bacterium]|nr:cobalt-precorrin-5B (C(1))-methyltransferase [Actinomycetota bacterium]
MTTWEPPLSEDVAARRKGLRTGWTTGSCASAAAKAAATWLVEGKAPASIEIPLPSGARASFAIHPGDEFGCVYVVKDAGDDPDCTNGAHVTATACWLGEGEGEIEIDGGAGVGRVTLPGLGLPVGAPAINAVPRRMITQAVREVTGRGIRIVISVPGGEQMATKTSNERLGILGGISILGTTGIVRPFSTASYRASVVQQIDVAAAQGVAEIVLCTGSRSQAHAERRYPLLPPVAIVEVGDFTGVALRHAAGAGITTVHFVAMIGKITKLAAGVMMTHFHRSKVDTELLARIAAETGAPAEVVAGATQTSTARHFYDLCVEHGAQDALSELCRLAAANCCAHTGGKVMVDVVMVDFDGKRAVAVA